MSPFLPVANDVKLPVAPVHCTHSPVLAVIGFAGSKIQPSSTSLEYALLDGDFDPAVGHERNTGDV